MSDAVLRVKSLSVRGADSTGPALCRDVSFSVEGGRCTVLLGGGGSGKSVCLSALFGLPESLVAEAELVELGGRDLVSMSQRERENWLDVRVRYLPDEPPRSELETGPDFALSRDKRGSLAVALTQLGSAALLERIRLSPYGLSASERRRWSLAQALAASPELVVIDRPTLFLDHHTRSLLFDELRSRKQSSGLLVATNDPAVAAAVGDFVVVLEHGKVVESGPAAEVLPATQARAFAPFSLRSRAPEAALVRESEPPPDSQIPPASEAFDPMSYSDPENSRPSQASPAEQSGRARPSTTGRPKPPLLAEHLSKLYKLNRGLFKRPHIVEAVQAVSLSVRRGETFCVIGDSGSGKTTLTRLLLALVRPSDGRVLFEGRDPFELGRGRRRALRRRVQAVFQEPALALNPLLKVSEHVTEGLLAHGLAADLSAAAALVKPFFDALGLEPALLERFPRELSASQRQLVLLVRALSVEPTLIVCDEPFAFLDPEARERALELLEHERSRLEQSQVVVSQDPAVVERLSHRTAVLHLGRIMELGPTAAVLSQRYHPFTRTLFSATEVLRSERRTLQVVNEHGAFSAHAAPHGCVFHPRCPRMEPGLCDQREPAPRNLGTRRRHFVACFHPHV